jgi:hypothetical protein
MKKNWNQARTRAFLACFGAFALFLFYYWFSWFAPDSKSVMIYFIIGSAIVCCFYGYRAFILPDEWFRVKEERKARWWGNHPRLRTATNVISWLILACFLGRIILHHFQKH